MFLLIIYFILSILAPSSAISTSTPSCWTAAGQIAPNDSPCYPSNPNSSSSTQHSVCCPPSSICSPNKLCILPSSASSTGQAHRGSCTDHTWASSACPQFCLSEHTGDDGLTGVNMTVCAAEGREGITSYCCNDWTGRRCDCGDARTKRVVLGVGGVVGTVEAENAYVAQMAEGKGSRSGIPWNTVGPVLVAVMGLGILSMLLYLARMVYVAHRSRRDDRTRNPSILEGGGRRFSEFLWNASHFDENEKGRADSKFSVGTCDTEGEGDRDAEREMSTKSVRFSISGRRSKSEGCQQSQNLNAVPLGNTRAETPLPVFREDIFTRRPSSTVGSPKSLPARVVGRPTFKRQDTDLGTLGEVRRVSATMLLLR